MAPLRYQGTEEVMKTLEDVSTLSDSDNPDSSNGAATPLDQEPLALPDGAPPIIEVPQLPPGEPSMLSLSVPAADMFSLPRIIVLLLSCMAAFLGLGLLVGMMFFRNLVVRRVTTSIFRQLLSRLDKQPRVFNVESGTQGCEKDQLLLDVEALVQRSDLMAGKDGSQRSKETKILPDLSFGHDSLSDHTLRSTIHDGGGQSVQENEEDLIRDMPDEVPAPNHLPLPSASPSLCVAPPPILPRTPNRRPIHLRELTFGSSITRPAWSLRADDAPALGIPSIPPATRPTSHDLRTASPQPTSPEDCNAEIRRPFPVEEEDTAVDVRPPRRRAYRSPVPELDVAFAMQLRSGFGLNSDSAWLLKFLVAMFGWVTVIMGNDAGVRRGTGRRLLA